jgi:hypothetical protein
MRWSENDDRINTTIVNKIYNNYEIKHVIKTIIVNKNNNKNEIKHVAKNNNY